MAEEEPLPTGRAGEPDQLAGVSEQAEQRPLGRLDSLPRHDVLPVELQLAVREHRSGERAQRVPIVLAW